MTHCADTDQLVSVATALGGDVEERLAHIIACDECKRVLHDIDAMREALNEASEPRPGFVDEVVSGLPAVKKRPSKFVDLLVAATNTLLASATAFFAIAVLASGQSVIQVGVPVAALAGLAGLTTLLWNSYSPFNPSLGRR